MKANVLDLPEKEYLLAGNRGCAGCGLSLAYRHILKALEGKALVTVTAGCLTVIQGMYPLTSVQVPSVNTPFASVGSAASGLVAGLRALRRKDLIVLAFAGDGATCDMGIQALSGAADRATDFIYICDDNEGYMNTGTQRSSSTPFGAITSTTPVRGNMRFAKDMPKIMEDHNIPYVCTTSSSYPLDLYEKMRKAKDIKGTRYVHLYTPCPPGWRFPTAQTVRVGKLAVETAMVVLYEVRDGVFRLTGPSKKMAEEGKTRPVTDYLRLQGRFAKLTEQDERRIQDWATRRWQGYLERDSRSKAAASDVDAQEPSEG
ncbi:MAG: thiamine pyrophosphate-dependent enzyme [Dehalococcoidia bacterium]|nr:thiamine pyrophosphate-dependent enzyme [Dehalococcoidia bacterium]